MIRALVAVTLVLAAGCATTPELTPDELAALPVGELSEQVFDRWIQGHGSKSARDDIARAVMLRHDELGITREDIRAIYSNEVTTGMPPAAVALAWGSPSRRAAESTAAGTFERWTWFVESYRRDVLFQNGGVVWWSADEP
ncbi:MAG: hypothetical protein AAGI53_01520 [Planctomycetota bacterium]